MASSGLIGLDFDGTLVGRDGVVSPRTVDALVAVAARGWVLVGATGRPLSICGDVVEQVKDMTYLVSSNGAELVDLATDVVLESSSIRADDALAVIAALRKRWSGIKIALDTLDGMQRWEPGFVDAVPIAPRGQLVTDITAAIDGPVRTILAFGDPIRELGEHAVDVLDAFVGGVDASLAASDSGISAPEIRPLGVSKASALEKLRVLLGISSTNTICFGDGGNDIPMLRWASIGVAMGHADSATRSAADDTTATLADDGIAVWLEQNLLNL